ncbi:hypothetical protein XENTR_v10008975 [Xenopus tropicalis]|uniref:non-specific serine/threonine protein kinase n=1 Tax=Xenopus tropicalis TaxID=8364 RepID=A0A8J0R5I4_XENTR|nr:alpha-protein kinase 3 isoform X1 [Xenopus tropicalis]KAE8617078.1 hypothetical protein XENTR_v10008975 [Xenopus tropicalis]KAE8617079.1 hypothetical protein XENTR_v10008975 [Xenopus tropicalis]
MGTRRPMSRTSSTNGRYYDSLGSSNGSASESEDSNGSAYSPRPDSRNYLLNVRPENSRSSFSRYSSYTPGRSTFCSIISQLTEETQPCFETTLKPKAVSAGCDAKFICMLSGYPEPEVTWYKDDEEMDRYCGLPKYEIFRNGNRHTLQIYKCQEEDAAIYQASARNNKGIVSCSGVLEVGTMTEYKIHQRWFAKLKRKAEAKMREIEQSRRRVKENLEEGEKLRALSPERIQRKRRFSTENKQETAASVSETEDLIKVHIPDPNSRLQEEVSSTVQQPQNGMNGFSEQDKSQEEAVVTNGYTLPENIEDNGKEFLAYVYETVEVITKKTTAKESYAKKKKKEDDPPVSKAETKKEEVSPVSSQKKAEGISPAPRRSRINKDHSRTADEKMEIQPTPVTANRRFAINTALPKVGKTISKDTKKPKESVAPSVKAADSTSSRKDPLPPKTDVFSLKDLYFGESMQVTQEEKDIRPAHERDQKSNAEIKVSSAKQDVGIPTKLGPQMQISEPPKAAPRRSKEQRELPSGSTPPKASTKCDASIRTPLENLRGQEAKPVCEVLQQPILESIPDPSSPIISHSTFDIPEQKQLEPVPSLRQSERESQEPEDLIKSRIASEDLPEDKTQTETVEKLKTLEMEYMALQKAYALLQQQLELSQKAEEEKKTQAVTESQENIAEEQTLSSEQNQMEMPKNRNENNMDESASSPVFMETDEAIQAEVEAIPQMEGVDNENVQSEVSSLPQHSEFFMEYSSEKDSYGEDACLAVQEAKALKENSIFPLGLPQEKKLDTEGDDDQSYTPHDDTLKGGEDSTAVSDSKIETMKDIEETKQVDEIKETQQVDEIKENKLEKILASDEQNPTTLSITPTSENTNELILLDVAMTKMETSIPPSIIELPCIDDVQELSISEGILETNIPGAPLATKTLGGDTNQSVVTLLRDVKAALESGVAKDVECPSESSSSSGLSPLAISSPEEYFVELMLPLSGEEEKSNIQNPVMPELEIIPINIQDVEESSDVLEVPISSEHQTNEESEIILKEQVKQDHSLVATLKNSLLKLFHMKPADDVDQKSEVKESNKDGDIQVRSPEEMSSIEGNVSPLNTSTMLKSDKYDFEKSAESMYLSSTPGKLTPASEEDISQTADSLQTSPITCRKASESSKKGIIQEVHSAPLTPAISRSSRGLDEEFVLNKDELSFSPSTARKIAGNIGADTDFPSSLPVPAIVVGSLPSEKTLESLLLDFEKDNSRKWRSTENISFIPSATPQELASGARRKIYLPKPKQLEETETETETGSLTPPSKLESPSVSPGQTRRNTSLLPTQPQQAEKRSPGLSRRMTKLEVPKIYEECAEKEKTSDDRSVQAKDSDMLPKEDIQPVEHKKANDPYKAPQVIRKTRAEQFSDASGNLKLWCQFFNILSDSIITWYKDEVQVAKVNRSSGDEGQVALAIVQASTKDCGVYQCTIYNDYGTDSTDCLLSAEILSSFISKEEVEVGEEIEMTPMVFAKGLADSGYWGDKFFGRIVMENAHVGEGFLRKSCRVKAIYGLEPIFDSGKTCIIKIKNLIPFGTKNESTLVEKNYEITIQECKIQNTTREFCKIFAAECRAVSSFGQVPEILPLNLIYRPANNIPYATIEEDLEGRFQKYCIRDHAGKLHVKNSSEIEQKCCTFQHWVYQWTNGNVLVTTLEGVGWKLTNIGIATKSKGYHGLKESCFPSMVDEFPLVHQCNRYCEMLGLKSLKAIEGLQPPAKPKGSRSPVISRKTSSGQSSPQIQKKGLASPQTARKGGVSPKITRKASEPGDARNRGNHTTTPAKSQ